MNRRINNLVNCCFLGIIVILVAKSTFSRDLDRVFEDVFNSVLIDRLRLSPTFHADHFRPAAANANRDLTPAINSLIANEVSSFPLSSTSIGVTFDFSTGDPVKITDSLGPIFAENAQTLGQGKFNIGFNHTFLTLDQFRGLDTNEIRFTFIHQDTTGLFPGAVDGLGDDPSESDTIDLLLDLDIDSTISAFYGTYGVTDNLDIGIAIPLVYVEIDGKAEATVDSFTFGQGGESLHFFPGDDQNGLKTTVPYGDEAIGLGDIALRLKYSFFQDFDINLAMLFDLRLPTGDEDNFLGTGETNVKITEVFSKNLGDTTAHVNVSYERRGGSNDSDEIEYIVGFDHKLADSITLAIDVIGNFDLNEDEAINLSPGTQTIIDQVDANNDGTIQAEEKRIRVVELSNVPEDDEDNEIDLSVGFRYSPSDRYSFLANIIVPLNDDGLRSEVTPTFGFNMNF